MNNPRIIVSLDYPDMASASALVSNLDPARCRVKVGKELFTRHGPVAIEQLVATGFSVFLDLKFHDIPNTVARACSAAAELGVWMLNVHASGGKRMIQAARDGIEKSGHKPLLIAVTVLTSMDDEELAELGVCSSVEKQVLRLARISKEAGADGVVCSAQETGPLRAEFANSLSLVTPGIRPLGSGTDDQRRIVTPSDAILGGSDYLVIGRPITEATDPLKALEEIEKEVDEALLVAGR